MPLEETYKNSPDVDENEELWRRIHERQIVPDEKGGWRPGSHAFKGTNISVDLARKTTPQKSIKNSAALAGLQASLPVKLGYLVKAAPISGNIAHALICGNISRRDARIICSKCFWVIEPEVRKTSEPRT